MPNSNQFQIVTPTLSWRGKIESVLQKLRNLNSVYILAPLTSVFFLLTLPPFRQSWIAAVAIVPLLFLINVKNSFWKNFLIGAFIYLPYVGFFLSWLLKYDFWNYLDALFSCSLFLGLFLSFSGLILKRFSQNLVLHFLIPPIAWTTISFIYDLTPLSGVVNQLLFYQTMEWMQICHYFGIYGIVFLFLLFNSSVAVIFKFHSWKKFIPLVFSALLLANNFLWGRSVLANSFTGEHKIALIQHNLPIDEIWRAKNSTMILSRYQSLALEAAKEKPEVIVFPSYTMPFDPYRSTNFFSDLAKETGAFLIVSAFIPKVPDRTIEEAGQYEVALLFSPKDGLIALDKAVEGPPFRKIHQVLAKETQVLNTPLGKVGTLLCFEDVLARRAKEEVKLGADILVALSNPGHFTKTFMPGYHLYQDQLRAIETGKPVIRVSANGYSAIIDPRGRIVARTELGKQQILYGFVPNQ